MDNSIWSGEAVELGKLYKTVNDNFPALGKEIEQLIKTSDENVVLLYARRALEVIVTELCETELKRPRKTEPLKGIIDKLNSEDKVPSHIITSMHSLNSLATFGTHPKEFDPEQIKPVLTNLSVVIKWYLKFKGIEIPVFSSAELAERDETRDHEHKKAISDVTLRMDKDSDIMAVTGKGQRKKPGVLATITAVILIAAVLIVSPFLRQKGSLKASERAKSIVVLPFDNLSGDPDQDYFSDGMMDEILDHLFKIGDLKVITRKSSMRYKNSDLSMKEIAKELGVSSILEGSVRKAGYMVRITVQLIDVRTDAHLWSEIYDGDLSDLSRIFNIQSEIAQSIARELKVVLSPQIIEHIDKTPTINPDAYEAVLKGNFYWKRLTANDLETAVKYYELAIDKDPEYASAYSGIGGVWLGRQQMGLVSPAEAIPRAKEALMKAFSLDSTVVDLSGYYTWSLWDWERGEKEFKRVIEQNPNDAQSKAVYSHLLIILGRNEEALKQIEIAVDLDPLNELIKVFYGVVLTFVREYDEAIKTFQDALKIEPNYSFARGNLGVALALSGRYKDALEQWKLCNAGDAELVNALEKGFNEGGYKGALLSYNKVVELRYKNSYWSPSDIAQNYAIIGDNDKALYWLEEGYQIHEPNLPYLLDPIYDSLRDDARFKDLCKRMKLPYK